VFATKGLNVFTHTHTCHADAAKTKHFTTPVTKQPPYQLYNHVTTEARQTYMKNL